MLCTWSLSFLVSWAGPAEDRWYPGHFPLALAPTNPSGVPLCSTKHITFLDRKSLGFPPVNLKVGGNLSRAALPHASNSGTTANLSSDPNRFHPPASSVTSTRETRTFLFSVTHKINFYIYIFVSKLLVSDSVQHSHGIYHVSWSSYKNPNCLSLHT